VDPSDLSPQITHSDSDVTLGNVLRFFRLPFIAESSFSPEVGTKLYIAPEVLSRRRGPRNHNKADMYSLGVRPRLFHRNPLLPGLQIVFFEMNYMFSTGSERIAVIEDLRKPEVYFPRDWSPHRTRQKQSTSSCRWYANLADNG